MDEGLFKRLLLAGEDDENISDLIAEGYLKVIDGKVLRTKKYQTEMDEFITSKKEALYRAVEELGSAENIPQTMEAAGITDFITFIFLAEELVAEGKLKKDASKNCVIA